MSAIVIKSFRLSSPLKIEEEALEINQKQGIVSILGSDCKLTKTASLRRTLSADMSSKKWLAQNGLLSPMKKIASSEELILSAEDSNLPSSDREEENDESEESNRSGQDDVSGSVQLEKEKVEKPGQVDIWSSILSCQKSEDSSKLPPPYIHPLVKNSSSSLSEKSLEICTESLGSETGSEGLSSYPPSENGEIEEEKEQTQQQQEQKEKALQSSYTGELPIVKYNCSATRKMPPRCFPPPLSSCSGANGPSLQMHSHREDGRLVLEAVSIPSRNYFHAHRNEGRLVLTLVNGLSQEASNEERDEDVEDFENVFNDFEVTETNEIIRDEDDKEEGVEEEEEDDDDDVEYQEIVENVEKENGKKEMGIVIEEREPKVSSRVINVHRAALLMRLGNRNPTWCHKFNKADKFAEVEEEEEEEKEELATLPQSLPPPPRMARRILSPPATAVASFNAYDYFWRSKPITQLCPLKNNYNKVILSPKAHQQQELVVLRRDKADCLVPMLRDCKEARRSLLSWEPHCVATS